MPTVMAVGDLASRDTPLKFLLLPPFGALAYLVFVNPANTPLNLRRIVLGPSAVALMAWILASTLGYTVLSVVLATIFTMLILWIMDAYMVVPPMALALLTLLLYRDVAGHFDYVVSVGAFTVGLYALYRIWDRFLPSDTARPGELFKDMGAEHAPPVEQGQ